ncbi:PREDICTED: indoleamine 2,3-dioxygenase 2-like [Thamnophis sirtalis]|uniref:Indoleamine 2,3-dioxygenase 2-like n=1 Tax=Thamnophis sirtalis TaxID=35019 RepID=A0A6I9Z816_9SAUR|nr:PREDICTED: indoleamine 2,3-dioxygenase 2-like [Thamnophis sirtalis]
MENATLSVKQKPAFTLKRFHISEDYGFLLPNPLKELPPFYSPWMEIAHQLVYLIESHQLRFQVNKMPLLSCQYLQGHRELYLAHLVLSFITMGYVWQEGEKEVPKILPRNLAIPFGEVSEMLSLPPILVHTDFVLVNWKKKNPQGYWKDNPALPEGLLYEGLCEQPLAYSGGSAAQSSTLHAFDELLGIQHQKESAAFLHRMRKYMPPHHQAFIEEIRSVPRLKDHVLSSGNQDLQTLYNMCVAALSELRTYHITMVTKYILIAAKKAKNNVSQTTSPPSFLEGVGTGGSRILKFLKSVRDTTKDAMIQL